MTVKFLGKGSKLSLIHGKTYSVSRVAPDAGWFCIIDETNEEYAYPPELFEIVNL